MDWTSYAVAQSLIAGLPPLARLIAVRLRETGDDDVTLMQIGVLKRIEETPMTTSDLAKQRKVSLQSASVLVQAMVERGWLVRVPDPNDRRRSLLQVTPEGLRCAESTHEHMTTILADMLDGLTADELAAAGVFLPALQRVVAKDMAPVDAPQI